MRKITFRAWDVHLQSMIHFENDCMWDTTWLNTSYCMQFTGLQDGEKTDVYDGDVIGRERFFSKVVLWHKNGFHTYSINNPERLFPLSLDEYDKVIGNIHQHPELIK